MKSLLTCFFTCCVLIMNAQLNCTLVGEVTYSDNGNDIWGYVADDGTEYALMGLRNGTSIVSLADPANPVEVANISGPSSTWRDLKSWSHYAYVSNETSNGILIIDLSDLPGSANNYYDFQPMIDINGNVSQLSSIHNLYVDEFGYLYVSGSNINAGGTLIFDLNNDPYNPVYVGRTPAIYAHDTYARNNLLYTSDVYDGVFTIYDVSDKSNIVALGSNGTPFDFTHNAWLSDDGNTLFTTDERADAPTAAYDVSDPTDIKYLDEFRPAATVGNGVVPHNAHVLNDYVVISHYTDGIVIIDGSRPNTLIEVANYDTYLGPDGGFFGCWGAYPFLPSGLVLASNLEGSLQVLQPNYVRGCYLEGNITDANTGAAISNASITLVGPSIVDNSNLSGEYATGTATSGTYDAIYDHPAYMPQTISVNLANGQVTIQDVQLMTQPMFNVTGQVVSAIDGSPIPDATVSIANADFNYELTSDASGNFSINNVTGGFYDIFAGKWGYITAGFPQSGIDGTALLIELEEGIQDEFAVNLGWTVTGDAETGMWERGEPIGTQFDGGNSNTDEDLDFDLGNACYVTGNGGGGAGDDDVDDGFTTLTSPLFDLSGMNEPYLAYSLWFFNEGGQGATNDMLEVVLSDGNTNVSLQTLTDSESNWRPRTFIRVKDYFPNPTANMQISFETADDLPGHLVEAAVDFFIAYDDAPVAIEDIDENIELSAFPNPFSNTLNITYSLENINTNTYLEVLNVLGQTVESMPILQKEGVANIGNKLDSGIYFVQIRHADGMSRPIKVIKE